MSWKITDVQKGSDVYEYFVDSKQGASHSDCDKKVFWFAQFGQILFWCLMGSFEIIKGDSLWVGL